MSSYVLEPRMIFSSQTSFKANEPIADVKRDSKVLTNGNSEIFWIQNWRKEKNIKNRLKIKNNMYNLKKFMIIYLLKFIYEYYYGVWNINSSFLKVNCLIIFNMKMF